MNRLASGGLLYLGEITSLHCLLSMRQVFHPFPSTWPGWKLFATYKQEVSPRPAGATSYQMSQWRLARTNPDTTSTDYLTESCCRFG